MWLRRQRLRRPSANASLKSSPGLRDAREVLLVGRLLVGVRRREHHLVDLQLVVQEVEHVAHRLRRVGRQEGRVRVDAEAARLRLADRVDRLVEGALALDELRRGARASRRGGRPRRSTATARTGRASSSSGSRSCTGRRTSSARSARCAITSTSGWTSGSPPAIETIGAPLSSIAASAWSTGIRFFRMCSGYWIFPQNEHARLHWKSGSSSTSSGNLSLRLQPLAEQVAADGQRLAKRNAHAVRRPPSGAGTWQRLDRRSFAPRRRGGRGRASASTRRVTIRSGAEAPAVIATVAGAGEPGDVDLGLVVDEVRPGALARGDLDQPLRVGGALRAGDEHDVGLARDRAHRVLAVRGRVADVVRGRPAQRREALAQHLDDLVGLVDGERRLGQVRRRARAPAPRSARPRECPRRAGSPPAPRPAFPRPPRGPRGRSGRSSAPPRRSGAPPRAPCRRAGRSRRSRRGLARRRGAVPPGETPCAEKTTVAPSGTSSSSSTKTAPRRSRSATTCSLWTICLRT